MAPTISIPGASRPGATQKALIYFISGNPGLVEYYDDFLACVSEMVRPHSDRTTYDIYGRDLLGFRDESHRPFSEENMPWDLEGQIQAAYDDAVARGKGYDFVVLMGHSVGAYIAVEVAHRHMLALRRDGNGEGGVDFRHGVLLFPTLTHIAASKSGQTLTSLLKWIPELPGRAQTLARLLPVVMSEAWLAWLLQRVLGFSEHAARTTAEWLRSEGGVRQALHLGRSEMESIREDVWEEEIWDVARTKDEGGDVPRWFAFYAREDHWVAESVRDEFVKRRRVMGEGKGRMEVVVDEGDVPHAFCTREASTWAVARKVSEWIGQIEGVRDKT